MTNSRAKGQRGEREVCHMLSKYLGEPITRELGASRDGGCDVKVTIGEFTYFIEVKLYRKVTQANIAEWWTQALRQANDDEHALNPVPVLIYRQSHWKYWEVVVPLGYMLWQLEANNKVIDKKADHTVTICVKFLTDLMRMKGGSHHDTLSDGRMDIYMEK
jgi:Holliday junction resolvase